MFSSCMVQSGCDCDSGEGGAGELFGCRGSSDYGRSMKEYSDVMESSKSGRSSEYASDDVDDSDAVDKELVELPPRGVTTPDVIVSALWREAKRPHTRG